jgi:hypothetical protein
MQFIKGVDEPTVPEVKLTRSRTGGSGTAMFIFDNPSIFQASGALPGSGGGGGFLPACGQGACRASKPQTRLWPPHKACRSMAGRKGARRQGAAPTPPRPRPHAGELGDITGLFLEDDEGIMSTTDVKAKFVNGKPQVRPGGRL